MKTKWLAVGIILLFVGVTIAPAIAQNTEKSQSSRGDWLYVGGSGLGNYSKIQDAIDNASDEDTVFVYDDSSPYYENLEIDKSIKLLGENKNTTIIDGDGNGNVVNVIAWSVTISGFTMQKCRADNWEYAGIRMDDTLGNTITNNIITNNSCHGIYCFNYYQYPYGGFNVISKNIVTKNTYGIVLDDSTYNEVYDNFVEENQIGIFVGSSSLPTERRENTVNEYYEYYNNIYRNTILNNHVGIDIEPAFFTIVFQNNIMKNDYGICINAPYLTQCSYNTIYQNNIHNNTYGIKANTWGSIIAANNISENNFFYNAEGISLCSYNRILNGCIANNTFSNNNFIGNNNTAYFEEFFICLSSNQCHGRNQWVGNYWEKTRLLPYPIKGKLKIFKFSIPWVTFDWHPAQEPYDIEVR